MDADFVLPRNNEIGFIEIASKLGIKKLYFLYDFDGFEMGKIQERLDSIKSSVEAEIGIIANEKNINTASKHSKFIVARSSGNDRFFIESRKIKIIYGFEFVPRKDYLHQRASGLNHVLCELAAKNNVAIGFSYSSLVSQNPPAASLTIGRMMQNIRLCHKYGAKTAIGAFSEKPYGLRAHHDIGSMFKILGMGKAKGL
ncbi:hypothetical protein HYX08_04030 [Candidatus Woesearchaeota archaeon]|nr:hypothetical protein [Candidatus Woesearchaeota archaeon]